MTHSPKAWSLRRRITARVLVLVMVAWTLTILISALVLDHEMNEMFDEELQALVETTILYIDTSSTPAIPREVGVETNDGERILRILVAGGPEPKAPWPALTTDGFSDSGPWRILRRSAENTVIEAAHSRAWRREEMLETAAAFLVLILPLVTVLVFVLRGSLGAALAPVAGLAQSVATRRPDDLSPVMAESLPKELTPLVGSLNRYIGRIETLRQAERQFIANAAHELRTPIAAIRARLSLSDDKEAQATVPMLDALTRRTERLLQLSRVEAGIGLGRGPADLVQVLRLLIDEARRRPDADIRFDDGDCESLSVPVDPDALAILLRNLIENALEHGTGQVTVRLAPTGTVTIKNPTQNQSLRTARFDKGAGSSGMGLGLSIVAGLVAALDLRMTSEIRDGQARVVVALRPA